MPSRTPSRPRALAPAVLAALVAAVVALSPAPAPAQSQGAGADADAVAAEIGDETITVGDVRRAYGGLPQKYRQRGFENLYPMLLERLVQQRVLMQKGEAAGLADDPEVEERMAELRRQVIHDVYLGRKVEERVSEEELRAAYDKYVERNPPQEEIKARHILVDTEQQARELIEKVTNGEPFAELAKAHSTGPSGKKGGELGWFARGAMVEPFEEAAFRLEANQFTADPVKTKFGWHIIMVEDKRTVEPPGFEEVRPQLLDQLGQKVAFEIANEAVSDADVQRYGVDGEPMKAPESSIPRQ